MSILNIYKTISTLPQTLEPNSIYAVRSGSGFDLYVSDATGTIAYPLNSEFLIDVRDVAIQNYITNCLDKKLGVLIPYYRYPYDTTSWSDWDSQTKTLLSNLKKFQSPAIVVINPNNGAGTSVDPVYRRFIKLVYGAGAFPIGYIRYGYGNLTYADLVNQLAQWRSLYPDIKGIFVDEIPYDLQDSHIQELNNFISYAKQNGYLFIAGNPGTTIPDIALKQLNFDVVITHETSSFSLNNTYEADWEDSYREQTKLKRVGIVTSQQNLDLHNIYNFQRYFRYIYITNDYSNLPNYFSTLLKSIDSINYRLGINLPLNNLPYASNGTALTTLTLTANRAYFIPFVSTGAMITSIYTFVSTAATGNGSVGLYSSNESGRPLALLSSISINTGTTGLKGGSITQPIELAPNIVYYLALVNTGAAAVRAVNAAGLNNILGITNTATAFTTHYYTTSTGGVLPSIISTLTDGTGNVPAIFIN